MQPWLRRAKNSMHLWDHSGYGLSWEPVIDGSFLPTNPVTDQGFAERVGMFPLLIRK